MKKISIKKKLFITIIFTLLIMITSIKTCYAENATYTRTQLQNSVVSTAVAYLYNNEYSDYSQKLIDGGSGYYNVDVFWKDGKPTYTEYDSRINKYSGTYPFRTFNQSPDSVSRTNQYYIDCSSFAISTCIYGLGVDFSEYGYKSKYPNITSVEYYSKGNLYNPLASSNSSDNARINLYKNSYKYYNARVLSTKAMDASAANSIKDGNPTMNITYSVNKNSASIKNKFVVYYTQVENSTSTTKSKLKEEMENILRPGDLIVRRYKKTSSSSELGHVVVYVGNKLGDTHGIIEASGKDMYRASNYGNPNLGSNEGDELHATGKEDYSVRYRKSYDYMLGNYSLMKVTILRPINAFCSKNGNQSNAGSEVCTVPDSSSVTYPNAQENIQKARLRFRFQKIRKEQYAMSGAYKSDGSTNDGKPLGKYNSVSPGDKITYNLVLTNNSSWKRNPAPYKGDPGTVSIGESDDAKSISKVTAVVPAGTTYVANSCGGTVCSESGGVITWTNIRTSGTDNLSYAVKVNDTTSGVVVNQGFTLYPPAGTSGSLNLGNINVNVVPTIRKLSDRVSINTAINDFNKGAYTYSKDNTYSNCNNAKTLNSSGFVKKMYCDAYGLNLDSYSLSGANVLNNFFVQITDNKGVKHPYDYELNRSNTGTNISNMLVPGMYGGTLLRGNDFKDSDNYKDVNGNKLGMDRIRYMTESDFEVGDIIVYYTFGSNATKNSPALMSTFYMYAGNNQFVSFLSDGFVVQNNAYNAITGSGSKTINYKNTVGVFNSSDANDYFVLNLHNKALFVVLRPSRLMTTVKYDFNGGSQNKGYSLFLASGKYKNLVSASTLIAPTNPYSITYAGIDNGSCSSCSTANKTTALTFKEWRVNNTVVNNSSNLLSTGTHTVKAIWKGNVTLPTPAKSGARFKGWKSSADNKIYNGGVTVTVTSNVTMTAQWDVGNYKITYSLNGGTATNPSTYNTDTETFTLSNPTKLGYKFIGWTGSNGSTPQMTITIPKGSAGDRNYIANFEMIKYTVKFNTNGGNTIPDQIIMEGNKVKIPVTPTKTDCAFVDWYKDESLTIKYDFNKRVVSDLTLYAKWLEGKYQISYDLGGGITNNQTYYDETTDSFDLNPPIRDGYTFTGWTGSNGTEPQTNVTVPEGSSGNKNYVANYEPNKYKVEFDVEDLEDIEVPYESTLDLPNPEKAGYRFVGWYKDEELTEAFTDTTMPLGDIELYSKWDINVYKIIFNTNGGNEIPDQEITYDEPIGELAIPEKEGYDFEGWYLDEEFTKKFDLEKMPAEDITVYAKWQEQEKRNDYLVDVPNTAKNNDLPTILASILIIALGLVLVSRVVKDELLDN